jgi:Fic family protein
MEDKTQQKDEQTTPEVEILPPLEPGITAEEVEQETRKEAIDASRAMAFLFRDLVSVEPHLSPDNIRMIIEAHDSYTKKKLYEKGIVVGRRWVAVTDSR